MKTNRRFDTVIDMVSFDVQDAASTVDLFQERAGPSPILLIHRRIPKALSELPDSGRRFNHLYFEKSYPGVFDNSKIKRDVPGWEARISLREGLQAIVEWYEGEGHKAEPEKGRLEDQLLATYESWEQIFRGR